MTLGLVDSFFFWIMIPTISTDYSNAHCGNPEPNRMEAFLLVAHLILHDIHLHTGAVASQGCKSSTSKANKYRFNGFNTSWWHSAFFVWGFFFFTFWLLGFSAEVFIRGITVWLVNSQPPTQKSQKSITVDDQVCFRKATFSSTSVNVGWTIMMIEMTSFQE